MESYLKKRKLMEKDLTVLSSKIEQVLMSGDLAPLSSEERVQYHNKVCESLGLNPMTKPFSYIKLNGKLQLYSNKDATDQLRRIYGISVVIVSKESFEGIYMVTAKANDKSGRSDESTGMVDTKGLSGQNLANAYMKAETKAKRRVTMSICGLGMLDESEVDDIPKTTVDVTPKTQTAFLPDTKNKNDNLIQAFMGINVSSSEILDAYNLEDISDLNDNQIEELRAFYKEVKAGNVSKDDFLKADKADKEVTNE